MAHHVLTDPSTYLRPDAARLLSFADRLDAAGDGPLARQVRRAVEGLERPPESAPLRGPLPVAGMRWR